jgi:dynein heavy chain
VLCCDVQEGRCLQEARPREMSSHLPVIHFKPAQDHSPPADQYGCPLYKTSVRAGVLSTTGQSTNFVLHISLPCAKGTDPAFWIMQGVAALCALNG